jgi:hypothetical protein
MNPAGVILGTIILIAMIYGVWASLWFGAGTVGAVYSVAGVAAVGGVLSWLFLR